MKASSKQLPSFCTISYQKIESDLRQKCQEKDNYIHQLERILIENGLILPQPSTPMTRMVDYQRASMHAAVVEGNIEELENVLEHQKTLVRSQDLCVEFHKLTVSTLVDSIHEITSVSSIIRNLFSFAQSRRRKVDILSNLTGRILPRKLTLLIGPPGSGKSVLLKALAGRFHPAGSTTVSGGIFYDGDSVDSRKFIVGKVADYIEQGDTHEAVLSVEETMKFSWLCSTGGHHSYARAKDSASAAIMNQEDSKFTIVNNVMTTLGLKGVKDTYVGNASIRGVSGGQKRRVTVGEMIVCPRPIKMMDCISNGLDTATTYDIVRAIGAVTHIIGITTLISLLQPPPDVYRLFDEVILLYEGHIIYHGARDKVLSYFEDLGYACPANVDEADFLQELPTPEGKRFVISPGAPHTAVELAQRWKGSPLYEQLLAEMRYPTLNDAKTMEASNTKVWYQETTEKFAGSFFYYLKLCSERQMKVITRDSSFAKARIGQSVIVGAIAGSLFNNIAATDVTTLNGFLFNSVLFSALGSFSIFPIIYEQKAVFYKQKDSLLFPTAAYTLAQTAAYFPLQVVETILYVTIVYWSAGLSADHNGSRFLTFVVVELVFGMVISQLFRLIGACVGDVSGAMPVAGIVTVIMVLFSGFIQPKSLISDGWVWFYWMNPIAWALKAVSVNELTSPTYNFGTCTTPSCSETQRFGNFVLDQYGNPTNQAYVWYSFAVLVGEYIFLFILTIMALEYVRTEPSPPSPMRSEESQSSNSMKEDKVHTQVENDVETGRPSIPDLPSTTVEAISREQSDSNDDVPFDRISMAFKDIWYTVTLPSGEDIDLLKGVSGFFEPGTVTALMGSSGAGKTTLLDVLAGRKTTGTIKGDMYLNGVSKVDGYFRKIMGYVEQFDNLHTKSTPREVVSFSAALRLSSQELRSSQEKWVDSIIETMELGDIQHDLIGVMNAGGMSFEQRKRISISIELAANPSILFLDEPTTGLDSRAAQALIRNIRRIASSGRSIVCTIHQPSTSIFSSFDSLLLLRRGGQTVFFGELGIECQSLMRYFEAAPGVELVERNPNPATWMLSVIGAGTNSIAVNPTDFHTYYNQSTLCESNLAHLEVLIHPNEGSKKLDEYEVDSGDTTYNTSSWFQFQLLIRRFALTYWRTPGYSLARPIVNIFIALIFASAYPQQKYDDYISTVSRSAVIYITSLFCGVLAMLMVIPMASAARAVFYQDQQSKMYSVFVYAACTILIEIPYLLLSSLAFVLPFFYIVGFDNVGNVTQKFFWYWFINFLHQSVMLYLGQFFVSLAPNEATAQVLGGLNNTLLGLFCGFLIPQQSFPTFWLFMYWLDPLHYTLEGVITSQFHGDTTKISTADGSTTTAEQYIFHVQFSKWSYSHIGYDVLALGLFIGCAMVGNFLCLAYLRHDKR